MVAAITGPAIRCEASAKASSLGIPSAMRRSANSVTMIASSTSIPTARMSENRTTILMVIPARESPRMPIRKDAGIARPISSDARPDRAYRMTMKTRMTAVRTLFSRSPSNCRILVDLSWLKLTTAPGGNSFAKSSATTFTSSTVSTRFAPVRFDTSMAMAGLPFSRAIVSASL